MRRNPCLEAALHELENAGVRVQQSRGGKHLKLKWHDGHSARLYVLAVTPSDRSTQHIVRADIRRMLRADALIANQTNNEANE
jgi:hypothetical protein